MVSITCYGGVNEIGGNKILLEDKNARIYLDFGQSFDFGDGYFYDWLQPRAANGLEVYFEFNLLPKIPKLYSKDMLEYTDLKYEKPDIDGVFISHSHSDHVNHLPIIDEDIPVYMGHGTHKILETYKQVYPQFYDIGEHNNLHLFHSGDKIKVKHLVIEPIHVDHSIPGAYGFIIHTSKGAIAYTGDIRMHGPRQDYTKEFIKKAASSKPYALLCEGTRMSREDDVNYSESEVEKKINSIISSSKGLVFVEFSMSNIDRFMSVYRSVVANKRKMVIDTKFAYILDNLREKLPVIPDVMADKNILVYYRMAKSCTYDEKDYYIWERKYMPKMITHKDVASKQKEYVMHMGFYKLMELVYIQPKNAQYIYSSSEHFLEGEDNKDQRRVMENWMGHFGIKMHKAHCSGHASREDLAELIRIINPKMVVPVHTVSADDFRELHKNVKAPVKFEKMEL